MTPSQPIPPPLPPGRWLWQRSLQYRIILTYGLVFVVVLVLFAVFVGEITYTTQLSAAENDLELAAFLAANNLEDPLSGYSEEFVAYRQWEDEREREKDEHEREKDEHEREKDEHESDEEDEYASGQGDEEEDKRFEQEASGIVLTQIGPDLPRLHQVASVYADDTHARVTILDARGNVVADSIYPIEQISNQRDQIEVIAALAGTEQHHVRVDPFSGEDTLFVAAPIQQGSDLLGVVQLSQPMQDIMEAIWNVQLRLVGAGIAALVVATVLGIWIGRRLVHPLRKLEAAALAAAAGDLNQQVEISRSDELGALAYAFNFMVNEVRNMLEQQQAFVANASHELRTPLTNIKLRSETLLSLGNERPDITHRYLREIDNEADRLGHLANSLLDLTRLQQTDNTRTPDRRIAIRPHIIAAVQYMRLRAEQGEVELILKLPERLPSLQIWPDQLEAILINLLDNAIKYTADGGRVAVSAEVMKPNILISVQDSGAGIPPADLPHIFDPFYQVDKARSRHRHERSGVQAGSGAGLGLSIVKTLVEQNKGQIKIELPPEGGSRFILQFPLPS